MKSEQFLKVLHGNLKFGGGELGSLKWSNLKPRKFSNLRLSPIPRPQWCNICWEFFTAFFPSSFSSQCFASQRLCRDLQAATCNIFTSTWSTYFDTEIPLGCRLRLVVRFVYRLQIRHNYSGSRLTVIPSCENDLLPAQLNRILVRMEVLFNVMTKHAGI